MDFRRCFGLRAPRPIGDSTILVPQLENYSLFAAPFLDLNKKIGKLIEGEKQDVKIQLEEDSTAKRKTRQKNKKNEEDGEKLSKEIDQASDTFGIVLNIVTVKPEQLSLSFGVGNEIEVKVKQDNVVCEFASEPFTRNCIYKYELPNNVNKNSLVALLTSDDYLIILPKDNLREDLLNKSIRALKKHPESSDKDITSSVKTTETKDLDGKPKISESKETKPKKSSKCKDGSEKTKAEKASDQDADELAEDIFENCAIPVYPVTRMLRPGMDIFMLRKYMIDLESCVSTARKFIENASFVSQNSKTAERCIRPLAKLHADQFYERRNLKDDERTRKSRDPSPDSGYTSQSYPSDESSGGSKMEESNPQLTRLLGSSSKE